MISSTEDFAAHVAAHAGVLTDRAEHATREVLSGIGAYLTGGNRQLVAEELPPALATALLDDEGVAIPLDERVLIPGMTAAQARELVASVCRVLAEELSADALRSMADELPDWIVALLAPAAPEVEDRPPAPTRGETLAAGRPGSRHPVSETPRDRGQTDSIAAANPHGAVKLSSTQGSTQERRHETLAEGQPGADRTLGGSRR